MELTRLRHILAVARTGSFSRAAEEEGITQPALSRSVAAFEKRYGVLLFDRGKGGLHLTPVGTLVIERATKLLAESNDLARSLRLLRDGKAGRVCVGFGPMMASMLLPRLASEMLKTRPHLQISAIVRTPDMLLADLFSERVEMIVCHSWQLTNVRGTQVSNPIELPLVKVVRSGHPLTARKTVTVADLADFPVASAIELAAFHEQGSAGFTCDNSHVLREVVQETDCIWATSPAFVAEELAQGALVRLNVVDDTAEKARVSLIFRKGRSHSPVADAVIEAIKNMLTAMTLVK